MKVLLHSRHLYKLEGSGSTFFDFAALLRYKETLAVFIAVDLDGFSLKPLLFLRVFLGTYLVAGTLALLHFLTLLAFLAYTPDFKVLELTRV